MSSLLFAQGYREVPGTAKTLKLWLDERREMGDYLKQRLERELLRLELLETQIRTLEQKEKMWLKAPGDNALIAKISR